MRTMRTVRTAIVAQNNRVTAHSTVMRCNGRTEGRDSLKFALGQAVPRTEDPRLLTGRGRYIDDFVLPRLASPVPLRWPSRLPFSRRPALRQ